jgi:hypothetical protein
MRTGGVEPPQPEATRLQRGELSRAQRPLEEVRGGLASPNRRGALLERLRSHPLPVGTPASHHRGPPGTCPVPLATPNDGPRSAKRQPLFRHSLGPPVGRPILQWRGWDSNPRSRAHEAREDGPSSTARGLAGWSRTSDLRCPKPAGWPLPYSQRCRARPWRRPEGRRPWNRTTLHRRIRAALSQPARRRFLRHRSEPARADFRSCRSLKPAASAAGSRRPDRLRSRRRQGIAPCLPGSQPGGSLLAVRRSLAGRSRTPVPPR